jgi:enoyl-[acyl-carrier protein] reductase III
MTRNSSKNAASSAPLAGKVALVTGASRGIGRAIALKLGAVGCDIAANYFNAHDEADSLCAALTAMGRRVVALQGNVADPASIDEVFDGLRKHFDHIDILVSNAASGVLRPLEDVTLKHWRYCMETNAFALLLLVQRALKLMPRGARIIAISSLGAHRAMPDYGLIGASKAALESLARSLAYELAPRGIRVNVVSGGVVETDALKAFPMRRQIVAGFKRRSPARRVLRAEEIADAVYLLCLPEAEMVNGHTVVVDGGFSIAE